MQAAVRLKRAVAFDGACWHILDPGSDLIIQHRLQDIPDRFPTLANNEYAVEDVNKFEQLAHAERKAATLRDATAGHPERSPRFRDLLTPAGLQLILRGATTFQAAQRLTISPHTISDHLKAIFDKTDARTRGELSAKLFFGEHLPRIQERVPLGDDASFIDAPRPRGRETVRLPPCDRSDPTDRAAQPSAAARSTL